jgi:hypothetical protein
MRGCAPLRSRLSRAKRTYLSSSTPGDRQALDDRRDLVRTGALGLWSPLRPGGFSPSPADSRRSRPRDAPVARLAPGGAARARPGGEAKGFRMIQLHEKETGVFVGTITEAQLQFLIDQLEEESADDTDYYIDQATLDLFEEVGAEADLLALLRQALGTREGIEIVWSRA